MTSSTIEALGHACIQRLDECYHIGGTAYSDMDSEGLIAEAKRFGVSLGLRGTGGKLLDQLGARAKGDIGTLLPHSLGRVLFAKDSLQGEMVYAFLLQREILKRRAEKPRAYLRRGWICQLHYPAKESGYKERSTLGIGSSIYEAVGDATNAHYYSDLLFREHEYGQKSDYCPYMGGVPPNTPEQIKALRAIPYSEYLLSVWWKEHIRPRALDRADNRCQICNSEERLNVHHRTYERLGEEWDGDVIVLCRACHHLFHEHRKLSPKGEA